MKPKLSVLSIEIDSSLKAEVQYIVQNELNMSMKAFIENYLTNFLRDYKRAKSL